MAAVRWLLGRQGPDGSFPAVRGDGADVAADISATSWALLALAEVATGDGLGAEARSLADQASAASARAAGYLLWSAKDDGAMAPSIHDHCIAGWAVSSALSRLGLRLVPEMPKQFGLTKEIVEQKVLAAVRHALSAQDPVTGRLSLSGGPDEDVLAAVAFAGFLHEVEPLPLAKGFASSIATARAKVVAAAAVARPRGPPRTPLGFAARSLLQGDRLGIAELFSPHAAVDPLALLYGTVSVSSHGTEADGETWWQDVLVPFMDTQVVVGKDAGSFAPAGTRLGRTHATALALLTWLYPEMEWREPAHD